MAARPRILLAEPLDRAAEQRLEQAADVVRADDPDEETLARLVGDCDALVARTHTMISRAAIEAGRRLRVIGIAGVGLDRVDLDAAHERNIKVINAAAAASDAVAELTVALILQLLRPIPHLSAEYRAGRYRETRAQPHGRELRELTVGIIGMGRIGSRVARICAAGFAARVLYNDIIDVGPFDCPAEPVDKPTIYRESDVLTLHVPLTDQTRGLINDRVFGQMRGSACLINTARGAVVDTDALVRALREPRIAGAALDVTDPEPLPPDHPLFRLENCVLLPHVAARTFGGVQRMFNVVDAVLDSLRAT